MNKNYLESVIKQMRYYKALGEKTFAQLEEDQIHYQLNEYSNSIAIIVKHLKGNMLSRWTNFLTEDGEKEWRNRDSEFEASIKDKADLTEKWEEGWACFLGTLESLKPDDMDRIIYIRNEGHSVAEAINRQLCHYAYHIGQIVFIGVQVKEAEWNSLSVPRGGSVAFNDEKFSKEKSRRHFTDD